MDIQYAGAGDPVALTSGQAALINTSIATGRTTDRLVMTTKGPISPAAPTAMSYSYSESSQVALSLVSAEARSRLWTDDHIAPDEPDGRAGRVGHVQRPGVRWHRPCGISGSATAIDIPGATAPGLHDRVSRRKPITARA